MAVRVTGYMDAGLLASVRKLRADLRDPAVAAALVADVGAFEAKQNVASFESEGEKSGELWAALSPAYAKWKKAQVGKKKILQFEGELRKSLTTASSPGRIQRPAGRKLEFGTRVDYAAKHQTGGYFSEQVPASTRKRVRVIAQGRNERGQFGRRRYQNAGYSYVRAHVRRYYLPARPPVRKSAAQLQQLRHAVARNLLIQLERRSSGQLRRLLNQAQRGMARPDPRA